STNFQRTAPWVMNLPKFPASFRVPRLERPTTINCAPFRSGLSTSHDPSTCSSTMSGRWRKISPWIGTTWLLKERPSNRTLWIWLTLRNSRRRSNHSRLSPMLSNPVRHLSINAKTPTRRATTDDPIRRAHVSTRTRATTTHAATTTASAALLSTGPQQAKGEQPTSRQEQQPMEGPIPRVGGRLQRFLDAWQTTTDDRDILAIIKEGYRVPFERSPPTSTAHPTPHPLSKEAMSSLDKEV
ncbi:hypothetical protein EC968_010407, partial [Mortierella alpina]